MHIPFPVYDNFSSSHFPPSFGAQLAALSLTVMRSLSPPPDFGTSVSNAHSTAAPHVRRDESATYYGFNKTIRRRAVGDNTPLLSQADRQRFQAMLPGQRSLALVD
jgi:hypothetical protein